VSSDTLTTMYVFDDSCQPPLTSHQHLEFFQSCEVCRILCSISASRRTPWQAETSLYSRFKKLAQDHDLVASDLLSVPASFDQPPEPETSESRS
jgi:hypothetical protein